MRTLNGSAPRSERAARCKPPAAQKKIGIERVDVIESREIGQDLGELLVEVHVCELDLAHIELADANDRIARMHNSWRLPLRLGEDDVNKVRRLRNGLNLVKVVFHCPRFYVMNSNASNGLVPVLS